MSIKLHRSLAYRVSVSTLSALLALSGLPAEALAEAEELVASPAEGQIIQVDEEAGDSQADGELEEHALDEGEASASESAEDVVDDQEPPADEGVATTDDSDGPAGETEGVDSEGQESPVLTAANDDLVASGEWGECSWSIDGDGTLRIWPTDGNNGVLGESTGTSGSYYPWTKYRYSIITVVIEKGVRLSGSIRGLFNGFSKVTSIDVSDWDTSSVTDLSFCFYGCLSLTFLDVSNWNTTLVENMAFCFSECQALPSIDVSRWDTSSVVDLSYMFLNCKKVASLNVSHWDTSSVTDMNSLFGGCSALTSLNVSNWDTSSVIDMTYMFSGCSALITLNLSNWDTSSVKGMGAMFSNCRALSDLDISKWDTSGVTEMVNMFYYCTNLRTLDLSYWNTSLCTNMGSMFYRCVSLTSIDLFGWEIMPSAETSKMFEGCSRLAKLRVGPKYDTAKAFPVPTSGNGMWFSLNDAQWIETETIKSDCRYKTDTYMNYPPRGYIAAADITFVSGNCIYDGKEQRPKVRLSFGNELLNEGKDYYLSYSNNVVVGIGTITVSGVGTWRGATSKEFTIWPRLATVRANEAIKDYGSSDPDLTATIEGIIEGDSIDYEITREKGEFPGSYEIAVTGEQNQGNYSVEYISSTLTIKGIPISRASITVPRCFYSGDSLTPAPTITLGDMVLTEGNDYELDYCDNINAGIGTITVTGKGLFGDSVSKSFVIEPKLATVSADSLSKEYGDVDPKLTAIVSGLVGFDELHYSLSRTVGENVGSYEIVPSGDELQGNYRVVFEPGLLTIDPHPVTVRADNCKKASGEPDPELSVKIEGILADDNVKYTISREPGEEVGSYAITPSGEELQGNYLVTFVPGTLAVLNSISTATISGLDAQLYDGSPKQPKPTVTLEGKALTLGTDYTLSWRDNVELGTATVVIRGTGNYAGEATATFRIVGKSIADATVMLPRTHFALSEAPVTPAVAVSVQENDRFTLLKEGRDYELEVLGNGAVGTGTVRVKGVGDYAGSKEATFQIVDKLDIADTASRVVVHLPEEALVYRGEPVEPEVLASLYQMSGPFGERLAEGVDYELSYLSNDAPGTGMVVMRGMGRFEGERVIPFTILSQSDIRLDSDTVGDVEFTGPLYHDQLHGDGDYLPVYLSEGGEIPHPDFRVYATLSDGSTPHRVLLEEDVDYAVDEWYTPEGEGDPYRLTGVIVKGLGGVSGSTMGVFLTADRVDVSKLYLSEHSLEQPEYVYRGAAVKPKLAYDPDFVEGRDYYLTYSNNKGVGTCTVRVLGMGRFYGSAAIEVPIVAEYSTPDLAGCVVELAAGQDLTYTSRPVCPSVRVTDPETGNALRDSQDYMLVYRDNVEAGIATVQVLPTRIWTPAPYQGQASLTFEIKKADISGFATERVPDATYTGRANEPAINVVDTHSGRHMEPGTDYTVTYKNNVKAGEATVTVTGVGGYTGTLTRSFRIERADVANAEIAPIDAMVYTGSALKPEVKVGMYGRVMEEGVDYDVSYRDNVGVGTATVTVTGKGNYTGTKTATFQIAIPFVDVTMETGHAGDICWLAERKVSEGWTLKDGAREFRPYANVARADMAAFLFRLAKSWGIVDDSWQPTGKVSFTDVTPGTAHYREVMWLAESGVSEGWRRADGAREFRPYASVARADMAAFLFRLAKARGVVDESWKPQAGSASFLDVTGKTSHYREVMWLASSGVSEGWPVAGGREFRPYANVARADMAAFLRRLDGLG